MLRQRVLFLCIGMVTFLVIIIAATSVYAQATQPLWRVILDGWCTNHGYVGVEVDGNNNNVFGLGCKDSSGTRYGLDLIAICTELYGSEYANPQYSDFNNPDSWSCYRVEVQPPPAVNQPQENSGDTQPVQPSSGSNDFNGQQSSDSTTQSSGDSGYTAPVSEPVQPQETSSESSDCIARSGLSVGDTAEVVPGEPNNRLRSGPSTEFSVIGSIPPGDPFVIVGGPSCGSGYVWWQVDYHGTVGWTAEGSGSEIWIAPATEETASSTSSGNGQSSQNTECPSVGSMLSAGQSAWVSDYDPYDLNVRSNPSTDAAVVFRIPIRQTVTMLDGPYCFDGRIWWTISYQGNTGWAVEVNNDNTYILIPGTYGGGNSGSSSGGGEQSQQWCTHKVHAYWKTPSRSDLFQFYVSIPYGAWDQNQDHIKFYYRGERVDNQRYLGALIVDTLSGLHLGDYWVFGVSTRWTLANPLWQVDANWSVQTTC